MKYRVTERQALEYTWEVDSDDLTPEELENALGAIDGVPADADCKLVSSETSHAQLCDRCGTPWGTNWECSRCTKVVGTLTDEQEILIELAGPHEFIVARDLDDPGPLEGR